MLMASRLKQGTEELQAIRNQILPLSESSRLLCEQVILRMSIRGKPLDKSQCDCSATIIATDN